MADGRAWLWIRVRQTRTAFITGHKSITARAAVELNSKTKPDAMRMFRAFQKKRKIHPMHGDYYRLFHSIENCPHNLKIFLHLLASHQKFSDSFHIIVCLLEQLVHNLRGQSSRANRWTHFRLVSVWLTLRASATTLPPSLWIWFSLRL